jgi:hypothetical protein
MLTTNTICKSACLSATNKPTAVVTEDSHVFQLLTHHADDTDKSHNLYMVTSKQDGVHYYSESESEFRPLRSLALPARFQWV